MKVDYLLLALKHHARRADGYLTDTPVGVKLPADAIVRVRYDAETMQWIHSRPSKIVYPTAKELIEQYRRERTE